MSIEYFYFLICILIPRLFTQWNEKTDFKYNVVFTVILEAFLLLPLIRLNNIIIFTVFLLIYHILLFCLEKNGKDIFLKRIIEFVFIIIAGGFVFGIFLQNINFNETSIKIIKTIINHNALFLQYSSQSIKKPIIYLFGILTLTNEINNIIRYILILIKIEPNVEEKNKASEGQMHIIDKQELNRGKIIGVIERNLFFFFVMTGNYTSIAFILTAKGIVRFKELDNKNFAEYVLIGTLLSCALSIFWAYFIKELIKVI